MYQGVQVQVLVGPTMFFDVPRFVLEFSRKIIPEGSDSARICGSGISRNNRECSEVSQGIPVTK